MFGFSAFDQLKIFPFSFFSFFSSSSSLTLSLLSSFFSASFRIWIVAVNNLPIFLPFHSFLFWLCCSICVPKKNFSLLEKFDYSKTAKAFCVSVPILFCFFFLPNFLFLDWFRCCFLSVTFSLSIVY